MNSSEFEIYFRRYIEQAQQARNQDQHHDHRRQIFLAFLRDAFDIQQADVEVEKYIQIANQQVALRGGVARIRKGWIDAIFHDLIFEFKRNLKREEADGLRELRDYLNTIPNGTESVGLLTDGLTFTAYVLDTTQPHGLRQIDSINLENTLPNIAYLWLDAYLLRQRDISPTSADIVHRFGLTSPTFIASERKLRESLKVFGTSEAGALEVKRQQWAFHLARVYGNADISNDEMFIRHTYLCQFAKILAFAARFGIGETTQRIEGIIDGRAFEILGVNNIGEQDFFAWVLAPEVLHLTIGIFTHIAASLAVYNLQQINEDLLKQLYQNLVEPETRHELGEFYTPDWLAEVTLREIDYKPGQSLLDPACGSGTFLFTAIRLLTEQGLTGQTLVDFVLENVMGIDVHPLAVTIAKINYMLAILPHLQSGSRRGEQRMIPVTMANALQVPSKLHRFEVIEIPIDGERQFQIPVEAAQHPRELSELLQQMGMYAQNAAKIVAQHPDKAIKAQFGNLAMETFPSKSNNLQDIEVERATWNTNARWLIRQIVEGRDSIWVYVLQNTSRPLFLRYRKFDVIVGNPPWISYRYLQDPTYQAEIKKLTRDYQLLASGDSKLNTQMELATLFFTHAYHAYLRPEGTIAFVMPRSVITGAKQHHIFQQQGFSFILDLKDIAPLFNVETCVLIRRGNQVYTRDIPTINFEGKLPAHECTLADASGQMTRTETTTDFAKQDTIASPYYHPRIINGANLYPRNLAFVTSAQPDLHPGQLAYTSIMRTDPDVDSEAKAPWKGKKLEGHIDDDFLYATLLSKRLVPFGISKLHLVALPVRVGIPQRLDTLPDQEPDLRFIPISLHAMRDTLTFARSANDWFDPAEELWQKYKKDTTKETLSQWLNYQNKITGQRPASGYLVLYGATGSNLAASVIDTHHLPIVNGAQPRAFVVDHKTYWYRSVNEDEVHFLAALLNAPSVDAAIKLHQTRGLFGTRDIHRRPFEVCPIPQFDEDNALHCELATLSREAHREVATLDLSQMGVVASRKQARHIARTQLEQIDVLARQLLGLSERLVTALEVEQVEEDDESE